MIGKEMEGGVPMSCVFQTERLHVRLMTGDDVDHLLLIFQDDEAMTYYPSKKNREAAIEWIRWTLKNYRSYGIGLWILEHKESREFIGQCGLVPQKVDGKIEIEAGYLLVRKQWNKGYATEAASACIKYGLNELRYRRIVSLIDPLNKASIRVAEKAGMMLEKNIIKWNKSLMMYTISTSRDHPYGYASSRNDNSIHNISSFRA
jgi:RimJ/RimL family protein N-acetyltransferase